MEQTTKKKPIFHIGYHKTGSTFLQENFWPLCRNYAYDNKKRLVNYLVVPHMYEYDPMQVYRWAYREFGGRFICSNEDFICNPLNAGGSGFIQKGVAMRIKASFPDARIVIFLREQLDYLQSLYVQYVKYGGTRSLERMLFPHKLNPTLNPIFRYEYLEYDRVVEMYEEIFGRENVYVYNYLDLRRGTEFYQELNDTFGLGINVSLIPNTKSNVKMRKSTLLLTRLLNRFTRHILPDKDYWLDIPYAYPAIRFLARAIDSVTLFNPVVEAGDFWSPELREKIKLHYVDSNRRLKNARGICWD